MSSPIKARIEASQQNNHEEPRPVVVRTLKDPPEIWDLVHETPAHFTPTEAFLTRLTASKGTAILVVVSVLLIGGLAAFAIMTLTDGRMRGASAVQQQLEGANRPRQTPTSASTSEAPTNAVSTSSNTSPASEVKNAVPESANPQPTANQSTDPTATSLATTEGVNNSDQLEAQSNSTSRRVPSRRAGARSINTQDTVPSNRNEVQSADQGTSGAGLAARADTANESTQKPELQRGNEKTINDSTQTRANPTLSPQLVAPPAPSPSPKAKVIQWP